MGSLLAGLLAARIGAPDTILVGGVVCVIGAAAFYRSLPALRRIARPVYARLGVIPEIAEGVGAASQVAVPPDS